MTEVQIKLVRSHLVELLLPIFGDMREREEIVNLVLRDVLMDIEATADWSELDDDEVHTGDISIALARVLYDAITFNYDSED